MGHARDCDLQPSEQWATRGIVNLFISLSFPLVWSQIRSLVGNLVGGVGYVPDHLSRLFFKPLFGLTDVFEGLAELVEFS